MLRKKDKTITIGWSMDDDMGQSLRTIVDETMPLVIKDK